MSNADLFDFHAAFTSQLLLGQGQHIHAAQVFEIFENM